jgi:hypothetical protein
MPVAAQTSGPAAVADAVTVGCGPDARTVFPQQTEKNNAIGLSTGRFLRISAISSFILF